MKKILTIAALSTALMAGDCDGNSADSKNRNAQKNAMERATTAVPVPETNNYLTRQNLAEWMRRMDTPEKLFYVYIFGNNGNVIGYYVARTYPQSICTFMTPPEKVRGNGSAGYVAVTAPALDGVYYKGGGCDTYFFFDAATDALVQVTDWKIFTSDQPLSIEADPIMVESSPVQ